MGRKPVGIVLLLAWLALIPSGCSPRWLRPMARETPPSAPRATMATSSAVPTVASSSVTAGATVLQQVEADLDNDGSPEQVTAYQHDSRVTIAIATQGSDQPWSMELPAGAGLSSLRTQDLNADRQPEVLIETKGPEADTVSLGVLRWIGGKGEFLGPQGEGARRDNWFRSKYYPPWIGDLVGDGTYEIVISVDSSNPSFLDSIVYEWHGNGYAHSDLFLMPPRVVPTQPAGASSRRTGPSLVGPPQQYAG